MKTLAITLLAIALGTPMLARAVDIPPEPGSRLSPDPPKAAAKRGVYGAPIQAPIVHRRSPRHKSTASKTSKGSKSHLSSKVGKPA